MNSDNHEISRIFGEIQGRTFITTGVILISDLTGYQCQFDDIPIGKHGQEHVPRGKKTQEHAHDFPSLYKTSGMNVACDGTLYFLPEKAAVIILPGISHSFVPQERKNGNWVASLNDKHEKQEIVPAEVP